MLLVWCNLEYFEVMAHEIEYSNELTMSFVDLVLLWSLCHSFQGPNSKSSVNSTGAKSGIFLAAGATSIAVLQMFIYNGMGHTLSGGRTGEHLAHYCEFTFEIMSALIAFWCAPEDRSLPFLCVDTQKLRYAPLPCGQVLRRQQIRFRERNIRYNVWTTGNVFACFFLFATYSSFYFH